MPWLMRFILSPRFALGSVHLGFLVDKSALGQVFSDFFTFFLSVQFHQESILTYIIRGMNNRPIGGGSSERKSHPINMTLNKL
jgi:hypothetical protein